MLSSIYQQEDLKTLQPKLKVDQLASQLLAVSFRTDNPDQVQSLMKSIEKQVNTRLGVVQGSKQHFRHFKVKGFDLSASAYKPNLALNFSIAILLGLIFGSFGVLFRHYYKE